MVVRVVNNLLEGGCNQKVMWNDSYRIVEVRKLRKTRPVVVIARTCPWSGSRSTHNAPQDSNVHGSDGIAGSSETSSAAQDADNAREQ